MTFVDIHILQSVPPSNINRDDTGTPKTAIFGGVRRARVSSQAWKRATRKRFNATLDKSDIGLRTKRVVEIVADEVRQLDPSIEEPASLKVAGEALNAAGIKLTTPKPRKDAPKDAPTPIDQTGYLLFVSAGQFAKLAELAVAAHKSGEKIPAGKAKAAFNSDHSFDVSLFGRMVADDAELNVDAAAQVAHAISVHTVENEYDYFTAVDDLQEKDQESGAGMIGTVEFNSSTLYRYATVNVAGLLKNLGDKAATARAVSAFVDAIVMSMPTGKQNTFANRTLPEAIVVSMRTDQPVNLVGAFENPVIHAPGVSVVGEAAKALAARHGEIGSVYGVPARTWVVSLGDASGPLAQLGERVDMATLVSRIESAVSEKLGASA